MANYIIASAPANIATTQSPVATMSIIAANILARPSNVFNFMPNFIVIMINTPIAMAKNINPTHPVKRFNEDTQKTKQSF